MVRVWRYFLGFFRAEVYSGTMSDEEDISSEIESFRDLCGLQTRDENSRHRFLESLGSTLKSWTNRAKENGFQSFISDILPCILRLSLRSPFSDIRESCSALLIAVKVMKCARE